MNEIKKKIYLFIFVVAVLNGFYCLVMGQYYLLIWSGISLMVAYFSIFPEEFFLCLNNAKNSLNSYRRNSKTSSFDIFNNQREEHIQKEDTESDIKRSPTIPPIKIS